jgi:hypothetical protein
MNCLGRRCILHPGRDISAFGAQAGPPTARPQADQEIGPEVQCVGHAGARPAKHFRRAIDALIVIID